MVCSWSILFEMYVDALEGGVVVVACCLSRGGLLLVGRRHMRSDVRVAHAGAVWVLFGKPIREAFDEACGV